MAKLNLGCRECRHPFIISKKLESEDYIMRTFYECKTEEQKQALRDDMLQTMYYQVIGMRSQVSDIESRVKRIEKKLVYVGATQEERKYLNVDGTLNLDAVNETCDNILALFGDKYIKEDIGSAQNGGRSTNEVVCNGENEG